MKNLIKIYTFSLISLILLNINGCTPPEEETINYSEEIAKVNQDFMDALANKDAGAVAEIYTENGKFLAPNAEPVVGKENILNTVQRYIDAGITGLTLETIEVEGMGDTAYEFGTFTLSNSDGVEIENGKYIVIWKKVDDQWKYYLDIFNSNLPLPEPETGEEVNTEEGG